MTTVKVSVRTTDKSACRIAEFSQNFKKYRPSILRLLCSLSACNSDMEDVVQKAALTMWNKYDTFKPDTDFFNWASTIAKFELFNHLRKTKRILQANATLLASIPEEVYHPVHAPPNPHEDKLRMLEKIVLDLPADLAQIIHDVYTKGEDIKDVAAKRGRSPRTYYNKLSLLRKSLLAALTN